MRESRPRVPIALRGLEGHSSYRLTRAPVRTVSPSARCAPQSRGGLFLLLVRCRLREIVPLLPDRPDDASQLVGQRHGGLVVPLPLLETQGPGLQALGRSAALRVTENRTGAMDEQHAEIG